MKEPGSESVDNLFQQATGSQRPSLFFSAWNIGEVLGGLDMKRQSRKMTSEEYSRALANFLDETVRLTRQGTIEIVPIAPRLLTHSWQILLQERIYQADALQIATCKEAGCEQFVSADRQLLEAARRQGLNAFDPSNAVRGDSSR